jgi:hypothetical protein
MDTDSKLAKVSQNSFGSSSQQVAIDLVSLPVTKRPTIESTMPYTWKPIRTFSSYQQPSTPSITSVIPSTITTSSSTTPITPAIMKSSTLRSTTATSKVSQYSLNNLRAKTNSGPTIVNNRPVPTKRLRPTTTEAPLFGPFGKFLSFKSFLYFYKKMLRKHS